MASNVAIFTKLLITQQQYAEIFYTELHVNRSRSTESKVEINLRPMDSMSLTPDGQLFVKSSRRNFMPIRRGFSR